MYTLDYVEHNCHAGDLRLALHPRYPRHVRSGLSTIILRALAIRKLSALSPGVHARVLVPTLTIHRDTFIIKVYGVRFATVTGNFGYGGSHGPNARRASGAF